MSKKDCIYKDGIFLIKISLGQKQHDNYVVLQHTHFFGHIRGSVSTLSIGSPLKMMQVLSSENLLVITRQ